MTKKSIYFENLDGLRFLSFLAVLLFHSFYTESTEILNNPNYKAITKIFSSGFLGVNFFFVLSGFLITYLLFAEFEKNQKINIFSFYIRRILRIWPLYILIVIIGFIGWPIFKNMFNESFVEKSNWLYYIFFTSNFEVAIIKILPSSAILGILWSIAIEEQFYLIWPHLTKHFKKGSFVLLCCLIIVASIIFRFYYRDDYSIIYYHTLSVISDMAIGGLIAYFAFFNNTFLNWVIKRPRYQIILLYVVTFSLIYFKKQLFGYEGIPIVMERVIFGLLFGSILLEQNYCKNSLFKLSKIKILSLLGKYTYGLYMYQFIGIVLALRISKILGTNQTLYGVILLETLLALIFTIIIAVVSYYVLEKRFLKLKDTFSKI